MIESEARAWRLGKDLSPVQGETIAGPSMLHIPSFRVPRALAEVAYVGYSTRYGTSQSLARLEERGGFGIEELLMFYAKGKEILEQRRRDEIQRHANPGMVDNAPYQAES